MRRELRTDLGENLARFYYALWRIAHAANSAEYRTTWAQLADHAGYEGGKRMLGSLQRYVRLVEEMGVAKVEGEKSEQGFWRNLRVTLLEPPELDSPSPAGVAQSVQASPVCRAERRRTRRRQRLEDRVRPYCPKGGRGRAAQRHVFSWGSQVVCTRYLSSPSESPDVGRRAPASGLGRRDRALVPGSGAVAALSASNGSPEGVVARAVAAWAVHLPGRRPKLSASWAQQLRRSAAQLDRLWGRPGAAAQWLEDRIALVGEDRLEGDEPQSLAFYARQLKQLARDELRRDRYRRGRRSSVEPKSWRHRGAL